MSPGPAFALAVPRLRSGRGAGAGLAWEAQDAREPMGTLGGAGLAAAAGGARTLGMEGECRAPQARSSGLPAGGAGGESPGGDAPLSGSSGSSALLQAEVLDLDEDEDDLEVFSKVRAARRRVPGKFQVNSRRWPRRAAAAPARSLGPAGDSEPGQGGSPPAARPRLAARRLRDCVPAGPE